MERPIHAAVQSSMKIAVRRMRGASVVIGKIRAGSASTRRMFAMFEPMMLPCARPALPVEAACTEITNSGSDVPKPTITMPTSRGETLAL